MPKKKTSKRATELRKMTERPKKKKTLSKEDLLSTGSTLLNISCTGMPEGGFVKGRYFFLVGDSSSGKTFLSLTCFAEASLNPNFKNYRLIYDDVEGGALMDFERFFGKPVADRVESPVVEDGVPRCSRTIEEFYFNIHDALDEGTPFIYVLDSMDSLSSNYEGKKFDEKKTEHEGGAKAKGDYGDGKAKINSGYLRKVLSRLEESGSILIIISQTRDNVGGGMFDEQQIHSGGRALKFYACLQLWSGRGKTLKKSHKGIDRQIGIISKIRVRKNRLTGREVSVEVPIYHSYGIDDTGSCVDFLVKEKHWKKAGQSISAPEFDFKGTRTKLIELIEEEELEFDLRDIVSEVYSDIQEAIKLDRKKRYE